MSEQETFSSRIESLSPGPGDLLVVTIPTILTRDQREKAQAVIQGQAERLGFQALVLDGGITASLQPNMADLLAEQQKQTALLEQIATQNLALIEALADGDDADPEAEPRSYLDGTPCR
ncbi:MULTISPECIES: hypothetical protein [Pseudomonas putida group]|uniref:hypothetical protein n=1 Tax=Pseudomonas putida group TaxID=136845 RepID=UPI00067267D4|nr:MULTISPECIES: hypothetical protein [Pseudomonas putida group]MBF8728718.1 hypothetical protein [Pseudomonas putida]